MDKFLRVSGANADFDENHLLLFDISKCVDMLSKINFRLGLDRIRNQLAEFVEGFLVDGNGHMPSILFRL